MLSRLKGIETCSTSFRNTHLSLWICFPVWRELKLIIPILYPLVSLLWICFPVWRELKQLRIRSVNKDWRVFGYAFPFEGNWNDWSNSDKSDKSESNFGYAFPFEGNWNEYSVRRAPSNTTLWICFPVWRELKLVGFFAFFAVDLSTLDMLSRLKGIETSFGVGYSIPCIPLDMLSRLKGIETGMPLLWLTQSISSLDMLSRLKGIETIAFRFRTLIRRLFFGYAFPFEGNWNSILWDIITATAWLWICFPVWRELKHRGLSLTIHITE